MIEYKGQVNLPNANFGVTERTITANEDCRTCDTKALAREIHHQNSLIPEDVAEAVLKYFCKASVEKMSEGFAIQLTSDGDVAMRVFPDIHVKGGNINLKRAREMTGNASLTEQQMVDMAGELIDRAGVTVSVRAVAQRKYTELLEKEDYQLKRTGIVTKSYEAAAAEDGDDNGGNQGENQGENQGGSNGQNGGTAGGDNGGNAGGGDNGGGDNGGGNNGGGNDVN